MTKRAHATLARDSKGPIAPPPPLSDGMMAVIAEAVAGWPRVVATAHWDLHDATRVDGIDFYVAEEELGHMHLDGSIHLATTPALGKSLVAQGLATSFPFAHGWVQQQIKHVGTAAAIALFRLNYDRIVLTGP